MSESVTYECMRCFGTMTQYDLEDRGGGIKCIHCGFRALKKTKAPIVKRVSTE